MSNLFDLTGKSVLVTGAASGIGRCVAVEASKLGANLVLVDLNEAGLQETLSMLAEGTHATIKCDLTSTEERDSLISQVGKLDGVVNCAGVGMTLPFKFCTEKELGRIMNINFFGPIYLVQSLAKSNKINKKASIVYMASIDGTVTGHIGNSCYAASKGAIMGSVRTQALEFASRGIRVNCVSPARVNTPLIKRDNISEEQVEANKQAYPMKRYAEPIEIAGYILYLLSDVSTYTSGSNLVIDGGFTIV